MAYDTKDDVDRLFACFKCGICPPESARKEKRLPPEKSKKSSLQNAEASTSTSSKYNEHDLVADKKLGGSTSFAIKLKSGKQISPIVFYGSPHGAPIKRPIKLSRLLHEIHADLSEHTDFLSRKEVWATFPRQEEAIKFLKVHPHTKLFSYQDHLSGQRRFLVSTYDEFWRRYTMMDPKIRHHYEVIQEGLPCHLYFDLEFDKRVNTGRDVDEMVNTLISMTFVVLLDKYSIHGDQEWIVELDSSTSVKFSRHVIIRIPETAFKDNSHAGAFVAEVCSCIAHERRSNSHLDNLFVRKDSSSLDCPGQLFLDSAVYSRNRCFRLAFSSKAGKNSFLLPTGRFKCKNMSEQQVFMESLICRMDMDCGKLLMCQMDVDCKKVLCFDLEVEKQTPHVAECAAVNAYRSDFPSTYLSGKSPFPALDAFVEYIASTGSISGRIRSWYWFSAHGLMVYSMLRNRYCERIGREHKSNHVIYVADIQRGVYYQKCHDPDCIGYRSPLRSLPDNVIPENVMLLNFVEPENCRETMDFSFSLELNDNNDGQFSCYDDKSIMDSCKESSWWEEAMKYADFVENIRSTPEISDLNDDIADDSEWWMNAEKIASQIEEQIG